MCIVVDRRQFYQALEGGNKINGPYHRARQCIKRKLVHLRYVCGGQGIKATVWVARKRDISDKNINNENYVFVENIIQSHSRYCSSSEIETQYNRLYFITCITINCMCIQATVIVLRLAWTTVRAARGRVSRHLWAHYTCNCSCNGSNYSTLSVWRRCLTVRRASRGGQLQTFLFTVSVALKNKHTPRWEGLSSFISLFSSILVGYSVSSLL